MISAWELYLWTLFDVADTLEVLSCLVIVCLIITAVVAKGSSWSECEKESKFAQAVLKSLWFKFAIAVFIVTLLLPSKKDAAMIWIVPQLATLENAELLQGEAAEIYNLAKDALKESIGTETVTE